jgi:quinoprotein relay system zinc metallohydrolase 2
VSARALAGAAALAALLATGAAAAPLPVSEVAPGLFVHVGPHEDFTPENRGGIANLAFVVGETAVAVIDAGGSPAVGRDWLETVRAHSDRPIRWLILTHVHPDHVLGAEAFVEAGAEIVGHARLPAALAARGPSYVASMRALLGDAFEEPQLPEVTRTVAPGARLELDLGGRMLELRAWPTAHTDTDITVFDRRTATLIAGDLLFVERLPVVDGSLPGWLDVLGALEALPAVRAVPGHGPASVPFPDALAPERAYLVGLRDAVRGLVRRGVPLSEAVGSVPAPDGWQLVEPNHGRNVTAAYAELEWE